MGKKLDALLGKSFKTAKFKATVNLAISRLAVLKNQRQARSSVARSDVLQLLNLGHHERALLRVELLIKEQNMLDVFVMIEGYFQLLIERIHLIEQEKNCPEELKEAASSLIYAATRCGEFPELQEIRAIVTSRFGKDFADRAVELRNNCGVTPKMIQKLSTRMPSLENRLKVLKEIAVENNIVLRLEELEFEKTEEKTEIEKQRQPNPNTPTKSGDLKMGGILPVGADMEKVEGLCDSIETSKKYKDVADAAQAAFESAAYAAAAARAAVELSRSESHDPDAPNSPKLQPRATSSAHQTVKTKPHSGEEIDLRFEKIHPKQNYTHESEEEKSKQLKNEAEFKRSPSTSSSASVDNISNDIKMPLDEDLLMRLLEREIVFDESEDETQSKSRTISSRTQNLGFDTKQTADEDKVGGTENTHSMASHTTEKSHRKSYWLFPLRSQAGLKLGKEHENSNSYFAEKFGRSDADDLNVDKRPVSVRTKRTYGR